MTSQTAVCGDGGWRHSIVLSSKDIEVSQDASCEYSESITTDLVKTIYPSEQSKTLS